MLALIALFAAGKPILSGTMDPDCFWHLRVAGQIERDGVGAVVDEISFSSMKSPWTPYSWLAELGMKALWDAGGFRAALFVQALMMAGFVVFVGLACHERTAGDEMATILASVFACWWALPYLSFRPVTAALVIIACCWWLIQRDRRTGERSRAIWWIIPLAMLGANVHFFTFLIPGMLACRWLDASNRRRAALLTACAAAASCATPLLPGVLHSMLHYQMGDPMVRMGVIAEFQPFSARPAGWVSVALLLASLATAIWNRSVLGRGERLLLITGIVLLCWLGRFAAVYAVVAAPILAATLPRMSPGPLSNRTLRAAMCLLLTLGLGRIALAFPSHDAQLDDWLNRLGEDVPGYPTAAAAFVEQNIDLSRGRLLNEFTWGGYLAWRFGPRCQVFMDGRTQVHPPEFWQSVYGTNPAGIRALLSAADADAAILPTERSRLLDELHERGWKTVFRDARAQVLVPPGSAVAGAGE